jgi:hypothetical protein
VKADCLLEDAITPRSARLHVSISDGNASVTGICHLRAAAAGERMAHRHESFWQCMHTSKEARTLNARWQTGRAPWKIWT